MEFIKNIPNFHWCYRKTRYNGSPIIMGDILTYTEGYVWENGHILIKENNRIKWISLSVWDEYQGHTNEITNFIAELDLNKKLIKGNVNGFGFGIMKLDQDYVDKYYKEIKNKFKDIKYWDIISKNQDEKPPKYNKF